MLMTMEEEYRRQAELFPNPERLEKVSLVANKCDHPLRKAGQSRWDDFFRCFVI